MTIPSKQDIYRDLDLRPNGMAGAFRALVSAAEGTQVDKDAAKVAMAVLCRVCLGHPAAAAMLVHAARAYGQAHTKPPLPAKLPENPSPEVWGVVDNITDIVNRAYARPGDPEPITKRGQVRNGAAVSVIAYIAETKPKLPADLLGILANEAWNIKPAVEDFYSDLPSYH